MRRPWQFLTSLSRTGLPAKMGMQPQPFQVAQEGEGVGRAEVWPGGPRTLTAGRRDGEGQLQRSTNQR